MATFEIPTVKLPANTINNATFNPKTGRYEFTGTKDGDLIFMGDQGGSNQIASLKKGADFIIGSSSNDIIKGGKGADIILCGDGQDVAYGGMGGDLMFSGRGGAIMHGEAGKDWMVNTGSSTSYGGADDDVLFALRGSNTLDGGAGNDTLITVGSGENTLKGGTGNDHYVIIAHNGSIGHNTISDSDGMEDFLQLVGIDKSQVNCKMSGKDMVITVNGMDGSLTIQDYKKSGIDVKNIEYLDKSEHLSALKDICDGITDILETQLPEPLLGLVGATADYLGFDPYSAISPVF